MKLYPKQLNSIEELRREKEVLKFAKQQTSAKDYFPALSFQLSGKGGSGGVLPLIGNLFSSKSRLQTALAIAKPLIGLFRKRKAKSVVVRYPVEKKQKKNFFTSFLFELIGSYITLKLLKVAYNSLFTKPRNK